MKQRNNKKVFGIIAGAVTGVAVIGATIWALCRNKYADPSEVAESVEDLIDDAADTFEEVSED